MSWFDLVNNSLAGAKEGAKLGSDGIEAMRQQNQQNESRAAKAEGTVNAVSDLFKEILQKLNAGDAAGARILAVKGSEATGNTLSPEDINASRDSQALDPRIGSWRIGEINRQSGYTYFKSIEMELDGVPMTFPVSDKFGGANTDLLRAVHNPSDVTPEQMNKLLNDLVERYDESRNALDLRGTTVQLSINEPNPHQGYSIVGINPSRSGVTTKMTLPEIAIPALNVVSASQQSLNNAYIMALPTNSRVTDVKVQGSQMTAKIDGIEVSSQLSLTDRGAISSLVNNQGFDQDKVHAQLADRVFASQLHTPTYAISSESHEQVLRHTR